MKELEAVKEYNNCDGCFFNAHYGCALLAHMVSEYYCNQIDKLEDCSKGYIYVVKGDK